MDGVLLYKRFDRNRRGEQEALQVVAVGFQQVVFLEFGLDALGDDLHAEGLSHMDDVVDDDTAARLRFVGEAKEEHVELQRFGADVAQRVE